MNDISRERKQELTKLGNKRWQRAQGPQGPSTLALIVMTLVVVGVVVFAVGLINWELGN